jgi:hypothetical protein
VTILVSGRRKLMQNISLSWRNRLACTKHWAQAFTNNKGADAGLLRATIINTTRIFVSYSSGIEIIADKAYIIVRK